MRCASSGATYRGATGNASLAAAEADKSGTLVIEAKNIGKAYRRPHDRRRISRPASSAATASASSARTARQDHAGRHADRRAARPTAARIRLGANLEMATLDQHRESLDPEIDAGRSADRRTRRHRHGRRQAEARRRLHEGLSVRAGAGAHAAARALRRRARPADAGAGAGEAVEPAGAGRADQRSRPRNARRAGGDARRLCRHRAS